MAVYAKVTQLHANDTASGDAMLAASYVVVDTVAGTSAYRIVQQVAATISAPGTWKDVLVDAIVADAGVAGFTLTAPNVSYLAGEPGDWRVPELTCNWTKDITKTNIGTSAVNVYVGSGGEGQMADFSPFDQYRFVVFGNKVGTGNLTLRLTDVSNASNTIEQQYTDAAGEFSQDSGWANLPAWATAETLVKPVAFSSVATDDPIFRSFLLYLR